MPDIVERLRQGAGHEEKDVEAAEQAMDEAADEIEKLQAANEYSFNELTTARAEVELLRAVLRALHDWFVEYARINNLFNSDGSPATFHELLQARAALEPKP